MKKFKNILMIILAAAFVLPFSAICVSAADDAEIIVPKDGVSTGEQFKISITFSANENIGTVQSSLAYDDSLMQFISSDNASGGGGILNVNGFPDKQSNKYTIDFIFMGLQSGSANISLVNCAVLSPDGKILSTPTAQAEIKISGESAATTLIQSKTETTSVSTTTTKSATTSGTTAKGMPSEGVLKSLTVDHGTLEPAFAYNIYNYTVKVENSVTNVEIEGETASLSDYIWYTGKSECAVGKNVRTITVTDKSGKETTYTINIIRAAKGETFASEETKTTVSKKRAESSELSSVQDGMEKYRQLLNPALAIVLIILVIALAVVVFWIKGRINNDFSSKKKK